MKPITHPIPPIAAIETSSRWFNRFFFSFAMCLFSLFFIPDFFSFAYADPLDQEIFEIDNENCPQVLRKKSKQCCHTQGKKPGPVGVAGLLDFASYEWAVSSLTTPPSLRRFQPIAFMRTRVLEGQAIQSSFPYDGFTLAPGDYELHVGLANNGGITGPARNLQLEVFVNSQKIFIWPALGSGNDAATPFISFSTIIHTETSSSFLQIIPSENVVYDQTDTGGTLAYLSIFKLNPNESNCDACSN